MAWRGSAWLGLDGTGKARHGYNKDFSQGLEGQGKAGRGKAWIGMDGIGKAWIQQRLSHGVARRGGARQGLAWRGEARQGKARQGKGSN